MRPLGGGGGGGPQGRGKSPGSSSSLHAKSEFPDNKGERGTGPEEKSRRSPSLLAHPERKKGKGKEKRLFPPLFREAEERRRGRHPGEEKKRQGSQRTVTVFFNSRTRKKEEF